MHMCAWCMYVEGKKVPDRNWFSPSVILVLGIKLRLSDLVESFFTHSP